MMSIGSICRANLARYNNLLKRKSGTKKKHVFSCNQRNRRQTTGKNNLSKDLKFVVKVVQ